MGDTLEGMSAALVTDSGGRATLGPKEQTFKVTELDGGALARPTEGRKYGKHS